MAEPVIDRTHPGLRFVGARPEEPTGYVDGLGIGISHLADPDATPIAAPVEDEETRTKAEEARAAARAKREQAVEEAMAEAEQVESLAADVTTTSIAGLPKVLRKITTREDAETALAAERAGPNRKGAVDLIAARLSELTESADEG